MKPQAIASSGSASAVSNGLCDFALGTDTGGSVRAPANHCGLYGLRPTHGRVSLQDALDLSPSLDTCGWFDFDPTNNRSPGEDYVTLAIGRDYGDVSPMRGVIHGGARHTLHVGVTVEPMEPGASPAQSQSQNRGQSQGQSQSQSQN